MNGQLLRTTSLPSILIILASLCYAQPSDILYKQYVVRGEMSFVETFQNQKGTVYLSNDSILFKIKKRIQSKLNFSLSYMEIKSIKRINSLIWPNMIKITMNNGAKYKIATYRRKKIIGITKKRIELYKVY